MRHQHALWSVVCVPHDEQNKADDEVPSPGTGYGTVPHTRYCNVIEGGSVNR
jgi:hypothetical protein